ncbi:hypothetical protein TNCV_3836571 [Trichonephila clavipes]|nr:hypothetical protein TNCV_3836571 [Trichonephila clavipes]
MTHTSNERATETVLFAGMCERMRETKPASSEFEYEFILLPRKTDCKRRLPAGSVFTKPVVQRHLPQNCLEESFRTSGIQGNVVVRLARRL